MKRKGIKKWKIREKNSYVCNFIATLVKDDFIEGQIRMFGCEIVNFGYHDSWRDNTKCSCRQRFALMDPMKAAFKNGNFRVCQERAITNSQLKED